MRDISMNRKPRVYDILPAVLICLTLILSTAQPLSVLASDKVDDEISRVSRFRRSSYPLYHELVLNETQGWIYGSDPAGGKIDVIRVSDLRILKSFSIAGSSPRGIALSPDGTELAIADNGSGDFGSILFLNPVDGTIEHEVVPNVQGAWKNKPWDVVYGRTNRLYSSGSPRAEGFDYVHVIDTATHTEIGKSWFVIRFDPSLVISSDNNYLFTNDVGTIPEKIYKFDVSTDTPELTTNTPHGSPVESINFVLTPDDGKLFTDTGQVWRGDLSGQLGNTGLRGFVTRLPTKGLIAISKNGTTTDMIAFYRTTDYYGYREYSFPDIGDLGPMVASSDGSKLFVSGSNAFFTVDLAAGVPGTAIRLPVGSKPYHEMIRDQKRGVLYGSNPTGHQIEVISMDTAKVVKRFRLVNGATPAGLALSPDGSELAVAQYGASSVLFINPDTGAVISRLDTYADFNSTSMPYDLVYGRAGRMYMVGNSGIRYGFDFVHVIDTTTHTDIGHSDEYAYLGPRLEITDDNNHLYVNEATTPRVVTKYDVSTDTLGLPVMRIDENGRYMAYTILLPGDESRVFTDFGQVWDSATFKKLLGTFSPGGSLAEIPGQNVFVSAFEEKVTFFNMTTFKTIGTSIMLGVNTSGPVVIKPDNTAIFVSTNRGVKIVNTASILPILSVTSYGTYDGWVLESSETSTKGGSSQADGTLLVGDDDNNRQYRPIISFNTSKLPDIATIKKVTLKIKKIGVTGTNPFTTHSSLLADIKKGYFDLPGIRPADFEAVATKTGVGKFRLGSPTGWYQLVLGSTYFQYINLTGVTEFRLRFSLDDNNDLDADTVSFYSGDATTALFNRPVLIIEYVVPVN